MWCKQIASARTVSVFDAAGAFEAVTRPGFETIVFSVEPDHLAKLAEALGYEIPRALFRSADVVHCHPEQRAAVRVLLRQILPALVNYPFLLEDPGVREALEEELPSRLLETLNETRPHPRPAAPQLRRRALRRALAHIAEQPHDSLRVQDLCRSTGGSERTLRRAFAEGRVSGRRPISRPSD